MKFFSLHSAAPSASKLGHVGSRAQTLLGPHDALAYGSILQTHMPFMTHVTRCPVVPTALLCAARVDVTSNCRTNQGEFVARVGLVDLLFDLILGIVQLYHE